MKPIKEIKTENTNMTVLFADGTECSHAITKQEIDRINDCNKSGVKNILERDRIVENLVAKYIYRDNHSVVGVWRYLNTKKEICASPSGYCCGQCKFFRQTGVYYSEVSMGCPDTNSWPYPVGTCEKHGFGPCLSAFKSAEGSHCGWEMAEWCKLDDRKLSEEEEREFRKLWE
jgi:hypothetical protein